LPAGILVDLLFVPMETKRESHYLKYHQMAAKEKEKKH